MLFNSYEFIFIFLPISFLGYFFLKNKTSIQAAQIWLLFCSLFFYAFWHLAYLPILLSSIVFNYIIASTLNKAL
ncbi:MAG: membrane-bound O-acyltransferase family protein, partial [Deltaproteobacteria bacterium]